MKVVIKKYNQGLVFNPVILILLLLIITNSQFYNELGNQEEKVDDFNFKKVLVINQGLNNDTTAPTITFIQPELNNTIIREKFYTIIANISDENPPHFGNVTIQISNFTNSLFNGSMHYDGGFQWSFEWDNITLYPNQFYRGYIIQILAKDSSSNGNLGKTGEFYIYLNIPGESPGIFNIFIYILIVCSIFAFIIVYLNRKIIRKISDKKLDETKVY